MARRAYLAGLAGGERLQELVAGLEVPILTADVQTSLVAETLFADEDLEVVESLAIHGNAVAAWFLFHRRQRAIEEDLSVDV